MCCIQSGRLWSWVKRARVADHSNSEVYNGLEVEEVNAIDRMNDRIFSDAPTQDYIQIHLTNISSRCKSTAYNQQMNPSQWYPTARD